MIIFFPPQIVFSNKNLSKSEVSPTPLLAEQLFDGKRFLQIFHYFSQNALQRKRYRGKMGGGVVLFVDASEIPKIPNHLYWMVLKPCKKDVPLNRRLLKSLLHTYTGRSLRSWYPNRKDRTCSTLSLQLLSVICCYQHVSELSSFMVNKLNQNHISPTRNNLKCHIILDVTT